MVYQVFIRKRAVKVLETIKEPYYSSLKIAILRLSQNPRPTGYIKLKGRNAFRIRVSNYRVIYEIRDNELIVEVIDVGHRKEIYD